MVLATPPWGPITKRSKSRAFFESGAQICTSLLMGIESPCGIGPAHWTVPEIVPGFLTGTTLYELWLLETVAIRSIPAKSTFLAVACILTPRLRLVGFLNTRK